MGRFFCFVVALVLSPLQLLQPMGKDFVVVVALVLSPLQLLLFAIPVYVYHAKYNSPPCWDEFPIRFRPAQRGGGEGTRSSNGGLEKMPWGPYSFHGR